MKKNETPLRQTEILDQIRSVALYVKDEYEKGKLNIDECIDQVIFSTLVVFDGESAIHGAEIRPYDEKDGKFITLPNIAGELHHLYIEEFSLGREKRKRR